MLSQIQYLIDKKGNKTMALVPFKQWEDMNAEFIKLQNKLRILIGIADGIEEVKKAAKSGKKLQTLRSFLDESRNRFHLE